MTAPPRFLTAQDVAAELETTKEAAVGDDHAERV